MGRLPRLLNLLFAIFSFLCTSTLSAAISAQPLCDSDAACAALFADEPAAKLIQYSAAKKTSKAETYYLDGKVQKELEKEMIKGASLSRRHAHTYTELPA